MLDEEECNGLEPYDVIVYLVDGQKRVGCIEDNYQAHVVLVDGERVGHDNIMCEINVDGYCEITLLDSSLCDDSNADIHPDHNSLRPVIAEIDYDDGTFRDENLDQWFGISWIDIEKTDPTISGRVIDNRCYITPIREVEFDFGDTGKSVGKIPMKKIEDIKGDNMSKVKDTLVKQGVAQLSAAEIIGKKKAGELINDNLIKILKKGVPWYAKLYAKGALDNPLAKSVIANVAGLGIKQFYPDNKKLNLMSEAMLLASTGDLFKELKLEERMDDLLKGVDLKALGLGTDTKED